MVITGSALLIQPDSLETVLDKLKKFSGVTYYVSSDAKTELVVTLEAEDHHALDQLCSELTQNIPEILNITHVYVNFEEEVEKTRTGRVNHNKYPKPEIPE